MVTVCLIGVSGFYSCKSATKDEKNEIIVQDVQLEDVKEEKKVEPPPPPPPPNHQPPQVEITKFTPPQIVKDVEVKPKMKSKRWKNSRIPKLVQSTRKVLKTKVWLLHRLKKKVPVLLKLQKSRRKTMTRCLPRWKKKQSFRVDQEHGEIS